MPKEKYIITVPQPCEENWEEMTPVEQGRFCAHCQKKVIDFTGLNDAQVIQVLKTVREQPLCGRYHQAQLNREIVMPEGGKTFGLAWLKKIAASLLMVYSGGGTGWARLQTHGLHQAVKKKGSGERDRPVPLGIGGYVTDVVTGKPLRGIEVSVSGTELKAITDISGCYQIDLPDSFINKAVTLSGHVTPQSDIVPAGSVILDVHVNKIVVARNLANLNLYPEQTLPVVKVIEPRPYHHMSGGVPVIWAPEVRDFRHPHKWRKLLSRKKKKHHE